MSARNAVLDTLLIVPEAHTRLFRAPFQAALYDAFHRDWRCRWAHDLCTPLIVFGLIAVVTSAWVPAGLLLVAMLVAYYSLLDRIVAALLAPVLALMWFAAATAVFDVGLVWLVAAIAGLSVIQAGSHAFEPVPPPLSGTTAFRPVGEFFTEGGAVRVAKTAALFLSSYWLLETWASVRVFALQVQRGLHKAGYRPAHWKTVRDDAAAYLAAPAAWLETA